MVKQQFKIQGMHCVGCAMTIDGAVEDLPGVKSASTNYKRQVAVVEYDERQVSETDILQVIHEAGYSGKVAESN
ncbi:MAG: heavy metal transporter [Chloroflexi bacterium]|nr:heavy metal transporter [Chloroflexota bacterium]